eukprot:COSAG02_NODE_1156_length_14189_cov_3.970334_3_plen_217_part_00
MGHVIADYGDGSFVMDKIFGTFRDSLEKPAKVIRDDGIGYEAFDDDVAMQAKSDTKLKKRKQAAASRSPARAKSAVDTKQKKIPPMSHTALSATLQASIYYLFTASLYGILVGVTLDTGNLRKFATVAGYDYTTVVPCAVAFGPLAFGVLLLKLFKDKNSLRWPFHKEKFTAFLLHFSVGFTIGVVPVYAVLIVLLKEPGYSGLATLTSGLVARGW